MQAGDLDECFFPFASAPVSAGPESLQCEMEAIPFNPVQSWLKHESSQGEGFSPASSPHHDPKHLLHEGGGGGSPHHKETSGVLRIRDSGLLPW